MRPWCFCGTKKKGVEITLNVNLGRRLSCGLALVLLVLVPALGLAAEHTCPAHLFVIERSKNANIVAYDAKRTPAGDLDASEPVVAYWLLNGEKDKREELNRVEKDKAYGVEAAPGDSAGTYFLVFKAER